MEPYDTIITAAARDLAAALRNSHGRSVYVVAVPTRSKSEPGFLKPIYEGDAVPPSGAIVRPCDNGASGHERWQTVPFSAIHDTLWHACRREPILPQE